MAKLHSNQKISRRKEEHYITTPKFDDLISHIAALRFNDFQLLVTKRRNG